MPKRYIVIQYIKIKGKAKNSQMIIRLYDNLIAKLIQLVQAERKNTSQVIRKLIKNSMAERNVESYIADLRNRISKKFRDQKIGGKEINKTIRESRVIEK